MITAQDETQVRKDLFEKTEAVKETAKEIDKLVEKLVSIPSDQERLIAFLGKAEK